MHKIGQAFIMLILVGLIALSISRTPIPGAGLTGTTWQLVSYGPSSHLTPAVANVATDLTFGIDGKITGSLGCNTFSGDYTLKDGKIDFGQLMSTRLTCEQALMAQESAAFQVLSGAVSYKKTGSSLVIYAAATDLELSLRQK
jgi:heat shock protein HslJ